MRKRCKNADEGVVLVAIQIAVNSDLSTEERCLRVQHTFSSMTSSPSRSSKRGEVVDEFRQHDGVVTVLVKNNLRRASPKHYENYDVG